MLSRPPLRPVFTLRILIRNRGRIACRKDGSILGNRERLLPARHRGYYIEHMVPTPPSRDRSAGTIDAGADPASSDPSYATEDHHASFRKTRDPMQ
jgi:ribonuclease T1